MKKFLLTVAALVFILVIACCFGIKTSEAKHESRCVRIEFRDLTTGESRVIIPDGAEEYMEQLEQLKNN